MFAKNKFLFLLLPLLFMCSCTVQRCTRGHLEETTVNEFVNDGSHDIPIDRYKLIRAEQKDVHATVDFSSTFLLWLSYFIIVMFFIGACNGLSNGGGLVSVLVMVICVVWVIVKQEWFFPKEPYCHGESYYKHNVSASGQLLNNSYEPAKKTAMDLNIQNSSQNLYSDIYTDQDGYFRYEKEISNDSSKMAVSFVFNSDNPSMITYEYPFNNGIMNYKENGKIKQAAANGRVIVVEER